MNQHNQAVHSHDPEEMFCPEHSFGSCLRDDTCKGFSVLDTQRDLVRYLRLDAARQDLALHHRSSQSVLVYPSDFDIAGCQADPSHQLPANRTVLTRN